ncbi:MAG: sugar-binding domain-containing protein [Actinomycetota bacterium]|nr:sugar-binding domain-containing protein [Actinomycetota bacterium]
MRLDKNEMAVRVSILYYEKDLSQNKIANKMGISRSYVSQLISYARKKGIVKISIDYNKHELRLLRKEIEFKSLFPVLKNVLIMSSKSEVFTENNIGKFAAPYVAEMINESKIIGINLGESVEKTVNNLGTSNLLSDPKKKIIQIMGGFSNSFIVGGSHPNKIVSKLGSLLEGECHFLNCPAIIEQTELRSSLLKENSIKNVTKHWDNIDLAIMGIGVANSKSKLFNLLNRYMMNTITNSGACCELTINFFDEDGKYIPILEKNKIAIRHNQLKKIKNKVLICNGKYKHKAIISAIRAKMVDTLITDSITINSIIKSLKN